MLYIESLLRFRLIPTHPFRSGEPTLTALLQYSGNPQYKFRSQAQTLFLQNRTGYYLDGEFSAGTATSERMGDPDISHLS